MGKAQSRDLYMQFAGTTVTSDAANATTLKESVMETGLSIRGQLVWLIHKIEVAWNVPLWVTAVIAAPRLVLSTLTAQATIPGLNAKGTIARFGWNNYLLTSGATYSAGTHDKSFLPPIPLAAPNISAYLYFLNDNAAYRSLSFEVRLGFTTAPMDSAMYTEIAETWGW